MIDAILLKLYLYTTEGGNTLKYSLYTDTIKAPQYATIR